MNLAGLSLSLGGSQGGGMGDVGDNEYMQQAAQNRENAGRGGKKGGNSAPFLASLLNAIGIGHTVASGGKASAAKQADKAASQTQGQGDAGAKPTPPVIIPIDGGAAVSHAPDTGTTMLHIPVLNQAGAALGDSPIEPMHAMFDQAFKNGI